MEFPPELSYSQEHFWVRQEDDGQVVLGISDYAQDQLGKVVYVDLPEAGDQVEAGQEMGAVESAKSVSDLISPVSGEVLEVNESLADDPAALNDDPYGRGWLARVKLEESLPAGLMSAAQYAKLLGL
ncbi:glycine cleavage system protein H [Desulfocarbo indianensis]|nr:glycine cleavage system protein H [Desulfocarbo indianensis]